MDQKTEDLKDVKHFKMNRIQVIKYSCCGKVFAACVEPDCYTDSDWQKELRKYVLRGDVVDLIDSSTGLNLSKCECETVKQEKVQQDLFSELT